MNLTRYERETYITFNEEDELAVLTTRSKSVMTKLDKLCERFPETYKCSYRHKDQAEYTFHKRFVRYGTPREPMSDERREQAAQRLASGRANKDIDSEV